MMATWKYEGRSAIILMTFVVQTLFIINGGMRIKQTSRLGLFLEFTIFPLSLAQPSDFPSIYEQLLEEIELSREQHELTATSRTTYD